MPRLILLPTGADLADAFAQDLVSRHRDRLPDLAGTTIVVPAAGMVPYLRRRLAHHAGRGLLGPRILTLATFAAEHVATEPALPVLECRLLLTHALRKRRELFPGQDNARTAEALFELFEELTAERFDPGADEAAFRARLAKAYGGAPVAWLSREARIVHQLWLAFREACGDRSPAAAHLAGLHARLGAHDSGNPVHLVGVDALSGGELAVVRAALQAGTAELWLAGREAGHDGAACVALIKALGFEPERRKASAAPLSALLDAAFAECHPERSEEKNVDSPIFPSGKSGQSPLRIVEAGNAEHEARCVDVAVREALRAGARDVVVLTEDRRLARRQRALLERAGVALQDPTGWA
ncbi:MAG: hypothetical protein ACT4PK_06185, partial [Gammaproteobacteria bacterium]